MLNDTSGAAVTLQVGNNNAAATYTGSMSGTGGLTQVGTAQTSLIPTPGNYSLYSGPTTVNAGTLA